MIVCVIINIYDNRIRISPTPRQYAEQVLAQSDSVLREAVGIAFPETLI